MKKICFIATLALITSCGEKDNEAKKGSSLNAPKLKPPVEQNIPAGFNSTTLNLTQEEVGLSVKEQAILAIKSYLAPSAGDASGVLERINAVDERMKELDERVQGSSLRKCLDDPAKAFTLAAALPGTNLIPLKMQCMDNLDGGSGGVNEAQIAFGLDDDNFYLFERTGAHSNAVLAIAPKNGSKSDIWQITSNEGSHFIHIVAEDGKGMEITSAADSGPSSGLGCGMHMKSSTSFVYVRGLFSDGPDCGTEVQEYCLKATDLTDASSLEDCSNLKAFTIPSLTVEQVKAADGNANKIITTPIEGIVNFMEESPNATEG